MYIRVEFEDLTNKETHYTMGEFIRSPGITCLSSSKSIILTSCEIRDATNDSVWFWHLDDTILNKHYGGTLESLTSLKRYKGVKSVKILSIDLAPPEDYNDFYNIQEVLFTQYINY